MTDINLDFLSKIYSDEVSKKIIEIAMSDESEDEKIKLLAMFISEMKQ